MLSVEFAGSTFEVVESLTFGRQADLELDTDRHLHRIAGEFRCENGLCWLLNRGSALFLSIVAADGTQLRVSPGARVVLPPGPGSVILQIRGANYEINYAAPDLDPLEADPSPGPGTEGGEDGATLPFELMLTPREVDFLVSFGRRVLDGSGPGTPTYDEVAGHWDVSVKTVDNTMQGLRRKLRHARIIRSNTIEQMVQAVIDHGLVGVDDLNWAALGDAAPPRRAADGPRFAKR